MLKPSEGSDWALVLSPESPYPTAAGGAIRTASIVEFLSQQFRIHLVTFSVEDREGGAPANGIVEQWDRIRLRRHSRNGTARAWRNTSRLLRSTLPLMDRFSGTASRAQVRRAIEARRYELSVIEHFWCAKYLDMLRARSSRVVLDLHNIESALATGCSRTEPWPSRWAHAAFARIAERTESELLPQFDLALVASEADQRRVRDIAPRARTAVYPNAMPQRDVPDVPEEHCIAFSGNLEYHPNVTAVAYFAREVWPELARRDAGLRWRLIGKNHHAVHGLIAGGERIEASGAVKDAVTELARAKAVVVPLLAGSGTRVKILEAWTAARPVVSTRVGAEGLAATDGENILLADRPDEITNAVSRLLRDEKLRRRLGQAGRKLVEEQYSWPAAWEGLERSLAGWLPGIPARIGKHP